MQVIKIAKSGCVENIIPIGRPMIINADCLAEVKAKAASLRLAQRHILSPEYHQWLANQTRGINTNWLPYRWAIERVEIVQ
jgi:hypothetical protein